MRNSRSFPLLVAGCLMLAAGAAYGAGFSIYEAGSKATALGCAFTATADDGSAIFYNAAGLSFQTGRSVDISAVAVLPNFKFAGQLSKTGPLETGESESKTYLVPGAYYTANPGGKLAYGIGAYAPFGLGVVWQDPENWVGRRISHDVQIQTVYITPAVSYMAADGLALAFGLDFAHQSLELSRFTPEPQFGENAISSKLDGSSDWNITPSLGAMYRPNEKVSLGVMYHFKKTMKYTDGTASLTAVAPGNDPWGDAVVGALGAENSLSSELNLPDMLSLGIAYQFHPKFRGEFNYVRFGWSTFESLKLAFSNPALDQEFTFNYENAWQIRFGFDYQLNETWNVMAGYVHDKTPQPLKAVSPLLPDSDRNDYSLGVLWNKGQWTFNASYMVVVGTERTNIEGGEPVRETTDYPFGTYSSLANLFGLGAAYNF